jgi:hypothetical protein
MYRLKVSKKKTRAGDLGLYEMFVTPSGDLALSQTSLICPGSMEFINISGSSSLYISTDKLVRRVRVECKKKHRKRRKIPLDKHPEI